MSLKSEYLSELKMIFKPEQIRTDEESLQLYGRDWTKVYKVDPSVIVFPTSEEQVKDLVLWARKHQLENKICLVPSGGRTGLSGGAVASHGEVVVSFEQMNKILEFNPVDRTVRLEPGVITEALQQFARDNGFYFPIDFAARGSSQIGGNIATNAGGVKVIRYGSMREWVLGLRVVTGQGEVLELNKGLTKNATGLDFRHLFIGSEGTLGFITEATIKLASSVPPLKVLILAVPDLESVMNVFRQFRDSLEVTAFEFFSDLALKHVLEHTGLQKPLSTASPNYLLIEVESVDETDEVRLLECFETCVENGWVNDGVISQSETQARDFWRFREDISESLSSYGPYKNDVSVTISQVPTFLSQVDAILKKHYPDFEVVWFGHIGDGNMHINILKPESVSREDFLKRCLHVNELLFTVIQNLGGSISAEHGVGLVKKSFLEFSRSSVEIKLMQEIKKVFDPDGIMNPGKVF
jgi:glycolate oxidase subunit GlcD